jgi:hypothetical protein
MFLRRALVLGEGALASAIADDLERTRDLSVTRLAGLERRDDDAVAALLSEQHVVVSALRADDAAAALRRLLEARQLVADANARADDALALDGLALEKTVAACVGCGVELAPHLVGTDAAAEVHVAALVTSALARRLMTGDFRDHWGIWTPERLLARVGMAHGIRQDLRERGVALR